MGLGKLRREWIWGLLLALGLGLAFLPVLQAKIYQFRFNDYTEHIEHTERIEKHEEVSPHILSHALYQWSVLAVRKVSRLSLKASALIQGAAMYALLAGVLFWAVRKAIPQRGFGWQAVLTASLLLAAPLALWVWQDGFYYIGYLGMANYHNPTIVLLKPFALINFFLVVRALGGERSSWPEWTLAVLSAAASLLAKPSFLICLLPAWGLYAGVRFLRRQPLDWKLTAAILVPSGLILGWQYWLTYSSSDSGILFAPLGVVSLYSGHLLSKFLLSILFPLILSGVYFKDVRRDPRMILAWLIFFFGAFYTYFLAESGYRFGHGNFGWSGEIAMFVLFVASTLFFAEKRLARGRLTRLDVFLLTGVFTPQVLFGVAYYVYCLRVNDYR